MTFVIIAAGIDLVDRGDPLLVDGRRCRAVRPRPAGGVGSAGGGAARPRPRRPQRRVDRVRRHQSPDRDARNAQPLPRRWRSSHRLQHCLPATRDDEVRNGTVASIPAPIVVAAVVALVGGVVLRRTVFGRHVQAIGANVEAARNLGLPVRRVLVGVYAISGLTAAFAGLIENGRSARCNQRSASVKS